MANMKYIAAVIAALAVTSVEAAPNYEVVRAQSAAAQAQQEVQRLGEQFDMMTQNFDRLSARVAKLESGGTNTREIENLRSEIAALRAENENLRKAQAEMRRQVVDEISKKMAALVSKTGARTSPAPAKPLNEKPPRPSVPQTGYEHVVAEGQSLWVIAQNYGVTVDSIRKANSLKNNNLKVGQKLFIPDPPEKSHGAKH